MKPVIRALDDATQRLEPVSDTHRLDAELLMAAALGIERDQLLLNPPGCNSSGSVEIAEGQTEAVIPMNAAINAPPQTTMICVKGMSRTEEGFEQTCSPFVPLTVEEQYVTFEFAQATVEQGKESLVAVKVMKRKDFEGEAEVTLLGLPANTTTVSWNTWRTSLELPNTRRPSTRLLWKLSS